MSSVRRLADAADPDDQNKRDGGSVMKMEQIRPLRRWFTLAVVAMLLAAATANAKTTRYAGEVTTSPGSEMSFIVVEKRGKAPEIRRLRISLLTAFCEGTDQTVPVTITPENKRFARLNRRGRFSKTQTSDRVDFQGVSVVSGQVRGPKGRGLVSFSLRSEGFECSTGVDRWEVDRVG